MTHTHQNLEQDAYISDTKLYGEVIALPLPPEEVLAKDDVAIYDRFMRHLRHVPNNRMEIKILSAIQFTADMLDYSDAHVAKALIDIGLRAPRLAFPADFLQFADQSLQRTGWDVGGPSEGMVALQAHWTRIGENKFSAFDASCGVVSAPGDLNAS